LFLGRQRAGKRRVRWSRRRRELNRSRWHRGFRKLKRYSHDFIIVLLVSLSFRYSPLQTGSGVEVDREAECKIKWREFFSRPEVATS
jgi:hypothetical protein